MKKSFMLVCILISLMVLFGCVDSNKTSMLSDYRSGKKEKLKYDIEQMSFSKSFQSIDTAIEIIENNEDNLKILVHLGLADYSMVEVDKILKQENHIDIYVSGHKEKKEVSLSVPQIIINLDKSKINDLDNIKFNIIYEDFTPIKIKFGINDVLNKLESHFKITPKSSPRFELINIDNNMVWKITYNSIFYKDIEDTTLINLHALVDANSGNIIESDKNIISTVLDTGHVLNYVQNQTLIYKKTYDDKENNRLKEKLYSYDLLKEEKDLLYTSNYKISTVEVTPDLENVSFIETSESGNEVFITSHDKPKVYKIIFEGNFNPSIVKWQNNNKLYILGNEENNSTIYAYDISTNELSLINRLYKEIEDFNIFNDSFLLIGKSDNEYNKKIFLTEDWKKLKLLSDGYDPKFIDNEHIAYIKKDENSNISYLSIYNLEANDVVRKIDGNVVSYSIFEDSVVYIKNNPNYNDYTLYNYYIEDKNKSYISHIICRNVYYNSNENIMYLNAILPFESDNTEIIYSIDLNNIKNP